MTAPVAQRPYKPYRFTNDRTGSCIKRSHKDVSTNLNTSVFDNTNPNTSVFGNTVRIQSMFGTIKTMQTTQTHKNEPAAILRATNPIEHPQA